MEKESLETLQKNQKKQTGLLRLIMVFNLIICVCMVVVTVSVVNVMPQVSSALKEVETLASGASGAINDVEALIPDLQQTSKELGTISTSISSDGLPKLYESLDNLNKLDMETLNQSIADLAAVIDPLARFFGKK